MSIEKKSRQHFIYFMTLQAIPIEQKQQVFIYTLFDRYAEQKFIFYVGYSTRPEIRYREHCGGSFFNKEDALLSTQILSAMGADPAMQAYNVKNCWIRFVKANGRTVQMEIVEKVKAGINGWERERRWMFYCLQQGHTLANVEAKCVCMVSALQCHPHLNVLSEPFESSSWNPVIEAYDVDRQILNKYLRKELRFEP